jgi:MFS family permease
LARFSRSIHRLDGTEDEPPKTVADLVEQAGRDAAALAFASNRQALLRSARTAGLGTVAAAAGAAAFALANWAAVVALQTQWSGWRAPLALALVWLVVAIAVAVVVLHRPVSVMELSPEEAEERFRATFDELTDAISRAAEQRVAGLLLPVAGGMVAAGEGMIEATDDVMEAADEITDALEERVPGGFVVNRVVDFALVPGRFGIRVLRIVLRQGPNEV